MLSPTARHVEGLLAELVLKGLEEGDLELLPGVLGELELAEGGLGHQALPVVHIQPLWQRTHIRCQL